MSKQLTIFLPDHQATMRLGAAMASGLGTAGGGSIMLRGPLGAGKTTLVRGLAGALPGHEQAEISSPSFNLFNLYPTSPPVAHIDLYRLTPDTEPDESILELLEQTRYVIMLEWPEFLPERYWPESYLLLRWEAPPSGGRRVEVSAAGPWAGRLYEHMREAVERELRQPARPTE